MRSLLLLLMLIHGFMYKGIAQQQWDISFGKDLIGPESAPHALALYQNALHIGGQFKRLNSNTSDVLQTGYVAYMKQGKWQDMNGGMNAPISALASSQEGTLIAAGSFTRSSDIPLQGIASWNGRTWSAIPGVSLGQINTLALGPNSVFAGGVFDNIGNTPAFSVAEYKQGVWRSLGKGLRRTKEGSGTNQPGHVHTAVFHDGKVFVGGQFDTAGLVSARNIAYWDGNQWFSLGEGILGEVDAMTVLNNGNVIVASTVNQGNLIYPAPLMLWDGTGWSEIGLPNGCLSINALATDGHDVFIGGDFIMDSTRNDYGLAIWNKKEFKSLGGGVKGYVTTLLYHQGTLYCGGNFLRVADSLPCRNIAGYVMNNIDTLQQNDGMKISIFPNPNQHDDISISFQLQESGQAELCLATLDGKTVDCFGQGYYEKGLHEVRRVLHAGFPSGQYQCILQSNGKIISIPVNILH